MRLLLALDGSPEAARALDLTASIPWRAGTVIEIVAVGASSQWTDPGVEASSADHDHSELEAVVADAVARLDASAAIVGGVVLLGRPGSAIVSEAVAFRADLVIVGSRGLGPIPTIVRGSVSAEIVDRAPCPVLVARQPTIGSVVVGVDGSASADAAVDFLAGFHLLEGCPVTIASVFPSGVPAGEQLGGLGFGVYGPPPDAIARCDAEERREHARYAAAAAAELGAAGYSVETTVEEGDPARILIGLAGARKDPLIVLGTHGRTGIARVFLGSVARTVLLHAPGSLLVVRGPVRERMARVADSFVQRALLASAF